MFELFFKCFSLSNNENEIIIKNSIKYRKHLTSKQKRRLKRRNKYIE